MTRLILVAAAGLLLATANTPPPTEGELSSVVAAPAPAAAHSDHAAKPPKPAKPAKAAHAAAGTYPRCSASVRDRCQQGRSATAPKRHREMQLAMRAGERG
ncbi:MAG TPA: hypothetical protein VF605_18225 [Allosphingosinicella sp.]|jgi:hypothetical protein